MKSTRRTLESRSKLKITLNSINANHNLPCSTKTAKSRIIRRNSQHTASFIGISKSCYHFYQIINYDDENTFSGNLSATEGALDLKVDFYQRGTFPPTAYHSEGHQDGMGLCLYLALMKKILGYKFSIAVLDDVLMSIDEQHKKSICKLLKQEFPETQFIITTHDKYWLKQMVTEGLVNHSTTLCFRNWNIDTGPTVWNEKDSWEEIDQLIEEDNVPSASHSLRRFLEFIMDDLSVRLKTVKCEVNYLCIEKYEWTMTSRSNASIT